MFAPSALDVELVMNWLADNNITGNSSSDRGWIYASITIVKAQDLLKTKYSIYENTSKNQSVVRTSEYSIPQELSNKIDFVLPTIMFGTAAAPLKSVLTMRAPNSNGDQSCKSKITPDCLKTLYNMQGFVPSGNSPIGITGYLDEVANEADLATFLQKYKPEASKDLRFEFQSVNGGLNPQEDSTGEAALDVQYTTSLTWPTKNICMSY